MKGLNELNLNEATMIEAVQFWLDNQWASSVAPRVINVKPDSNGGYSCIFIVTLEGEVVSDDLANPT